MRSTVRWLLGLLAVVFAVAGIGLLTPARPLVAQPAKKTPGTELVPTDGFAVLSVNVAKLHDSDAAKPIRESLEKGDKALLKRLKEDYGLTLDQLDRLTFLWSEPMFGTGPESATVFVTTRKPIDRTKLLKAWRGTPEPRNGGFGFAGGVGFAGFGQFGNLGGQLGLMGGRVLPGGGVFQAVPVQVLGGNEDPKAKPADAKPKPLDLNAPFYYCGNYGEQVIVPVDDTTMVVLPMTAYTSGPALVAGLLRRKADGPLAEVLALADKHDVVFGVQGKQLRDQIKMYREGFGAFEGVVIDGPGVPPPPPVNPDAPQKVEDQFTPYEPIVEFDRAVATFDLGATTKLTVTAHFPTAEAAKKAEPVAKTVLKSALDALTEMRQATAGDANEKDWLPVIDMGLTALKAAKLETNGKTLTATAVADIGAELKAAMQVLPTKIHEAADRMRLANNLKQLGLALHTYHDANGHLPKDVMDENGKVLLSWRVELLPYLEENDLYTRIDRTKAWDDPANKKLWDEMPAVFKVPARPAKEKHETFFQTFRTANWLGKDDPWQVDGHNVTIPDVVDGTSNTAAVFEMEEATNWMKPGDRVFDAKKLAKIGNPKTGKAAVLMLDGSVKTLDAKKYTGEKLVPLITVNGGDDPMLEEGK